MFNAQEEIARRERLLDPIRKLGCATYQAFLDAGYREWHLGGSSLHSTPYLLQKCIRGEDGTKLYFIDVLVYDWTEFQDRSVTDIGWQPEAHFNTQSETKQPFQVVMLTNNNDTANPVAIETFFQRIYDAMACDPYGND
jgi:hypothetical protein